MTREAWKQQGQQGPQEHDSKAQWAESTSRQEAIGLLRMLLSKTQRAPNDTIATPCERLGAAASSTKGTHPNTNHLGDAPRILVTTMMVRGIPAAFTTAQLQELWPQSGSWDLLYFPRRADGKAARGYAFVNFVSEERAADFQRRWQGLKLSPFCTGEGLRIAPSRTQGWDANVQQLRSKPIEGLLQRGSEPAIFRNGKPVRLHEL